MRKIGTVRVVQGREVEVTKLYMYVSNSDFQVEYKSGKNRRREEMAFFDEMLLILGYCQRLGEKYEGNGYFLLPLSKENIILNLARLNKVSPLIARKELKEFLAAYKDDIEIRKYEYTYSTGYYNIYYHRNVRKKCYLSDQEFFGETEEGVILGEELVKKADEVYKGYQPDCEQIYRELIEKINTVKDLIFLALLKQILWSNCQGTPAQIRYISSSFGRIGIFTFNLKKFMMELDIDKGLIDGLFEFGSKFTEFGDDMGEYFLKYLPPNPRAFLILNAHDFNSSSCGLAKCLYLHETLARYIYERLEKLPMEEFVHETYLSKVSEFERKHGSPVFKSKNREFQFFEEIMPKFSQGKRVFVFTVDEYEQELKILCGKGILTVEEDEIKVNDKEKLEAYYYSLREIEQELLDTVTDKFIRQWLSMKLKIEGNRILAQEKIEQESIKPEPPPKVPLKEPLPPQGLSEGEEGGEIIKVFLGDDVFWEPGSLNNGHFIIIGGSGAGKTETIRCIASELDKQGYPVLMIDFHGDMACENCNIRTYVMKEGGGYYFNPLELDPKFEEITPLRATSDFVDAIFINFPTLGIQQREDLKEIIKKSYNEVGITSKKETWSRELKFNEIENEIKLSEDKTTQTLKAYLNDIFDYELFSGTEKISVGKVLEDGVTHLNLKPLPEPLKFLCADLFLRKLYYSLQSLGEIPRGDITDKEKFRLFVIVDEAKLLVSEKQGIKAVLNKYAAELRKFGVGLILASQLITHFTDEILSNIAVKLCMKAENEVQARKNNTFFGVGVDDLIKLDRGEGILIIGEDKMGVKIVPTWERQTVYDEKIKRVYF